MRRALETLVALLLAVPAARAAVVAAPGYAVHTITTPDTVEGGVVRQGDAILVGQGPSFTAGAQSIVRLVAGGPTTIATGFNSLGGFDLAPDGTLYVVDNCFTGDGCGTTATGDTVYAIPDALTRTTAVTAPGHEVVPPGTIPFASDVFVAPDGAALVSDAAGNGAGRVVRVVPGTATDLIGGLDLVGGITLAADGTLRIVDAVLNPDFSTTGKVLESKLDGTPLGTLVSGLAGGFAAATDGAGNVLVSSIGPFGSSKVIAVAPDGGVSDRATGFGFSGDVFFDAVRDEALVLDFGVTDIVAVCRDQDGDGVCDADEPPTTTTQAPTTTTTSTTTTLRPTTTTQAPTTTITCTGAAVARAKLMLGKLAPPAGGDTRAFKGEMRIPPSPAGDPGATGAPAIVGAGVDLGNRGRRRSSSTPPPASAARPVSPAPRRRRCASTRRSAGRCSVSEGVSRCRERAQCPTEKKWSFRGVAVRTARWRSTNCAGARGMRSWRSRRRGPAGSAASPTPAGGA